MPLRPYHLLILLCAVLTVLVFAVTAPERAGAEPAAAAPQRPVVFVPGLLGSMLCRPNEDGGREIVWGTLDAIGAFPSLAVAQDDGIEPCGLVREFSVLGVYTQTVYGPFIDRLIAEGYREGETLFVFDYDWRLSVLDNAGRLATFVDEHLEAGAPFDIVAHSMGGLIARSYIVGAGESVAVRRLVTAGTPWRGSVQVMEFLRAGLGLGNIAVGGIETFREVVLSFPSTLELLPAYEGCCDEAAFVPSEPEHWAALNWAGIDARSIPDLSDLEARQQRIATVASSRLPPAIDEAFVLGVDQRTPQSFTLTTGAGEAQLDVAASWDGDSTVLRDSAQLGDRAYTTSFATHDAILSESSAQDFVVAALQRGSASALAAIPVRERSNILTELGELVQLVGVAITTDQPAYVPGATAKVTVHLRLTKGDPIAAETIRVSASRPDGTVLDLLLVPDPGASDPSIPFEQSFSAEMDVGAAAGPLVLSARLEGTAGGTRTVEAMVPVYAARGS